MAEPGKVTWNASAFRLPLDGVIVMADAEQLPAQATNRYVGNVVRANLLAALGIGVAKIQNPALRHHCVEIEILLQTFPELHRKFVERLVAVQQIVRPYDRGVAANVAAAGEPDVDTAQTREQKGEGHRAGQVTEQDRQHHCNGTRSSGS